MVFSVTLMLLPLGPALARADDDSRGSLAREACLYRQEGYEAQRAGDMDEAIANYQKAILLDPAYATAYNDLGVSYETLGQLERAKQAYTQCLKINPRHASASVNLARLSEQQGTFDGALRSRASLPTTRASPLSNSDPELESEVGRLTNELAKTYYDLGVAYTELRAYPKAIDAYEKSVALDPASPQAHAHLGLLYKQVRNDPDRASRHLHTYLRLNPHAADREELEALLALMQRDQPARSSTGSSAATWGIP